MPSARFARGVHCSLLSVEAEPALPHQVQHGSHSSNQRNPIAVKQAHEKADGVRAVVIHQAGNGYLASCISDVTRRDVACRIF